MFIACLAIPFSLLSNSHTKQHEIIFPEGSSFVTEEVHQQLVAVYNQIPELQFSTIICKDNQGEVRIHHHTLARQRAVSVQEIFFSFGMSKKHVKITYGNVPVVLVFKPKAIYETSSYVTNEVVQHKRLHHLKANKKSYLLSDQNHLFVFVPYSFETSDGTVVKKGDIDVELTELSSNEDVIKCGVTGDNSLHVKEYGLYFHVAAFQNGKQLHLRPGYVYKVFVDSSEVKSDMESFKGKVIDEVMVWRPDKQAKLRYKYLSIGELKRPKDNAIKNTFLSHVNEGMKTEWILGSMGWNKCEKKLDIQKTNKVLVSIDTEDQYGLYLASNQGNVIIPASENLNFKNLFEFTYVPQNQSFQLIIVPIDQDLTMYYYNDSIDSNMKYKSVDLVRCHENTAYNCVKIK